MSLARELRRNLDTPLVCYFPGVIIVDEAEEEGDKVQLL